MAKEFNRNVEIKMIALRYLTPDKEIQRPFDPAWAAKIASEFDPEKFSPLDVTKGPGNSYRVFRGQHHCEAAKIHYAPDLDVEVPCIVHLATSVERRAQIAIAQDNMKNWRPVDKFLRRVTAKEEAPVAITKIVESLGLQIQDGGGASRISAVAALENVYSNYGPETLKRTLSLLDAAYGAKDTMKFNAVLLNGVGELLDLYPDLKTSVLAQKLSKHGNATRLYQAAKSKASTEGLNTGVCAAFFMAKIYNVGRQRDRMEVDVNRKRKAA